ncbi:MAG: hypothetical protein R2754_02155 [Microthrixaceae bacterium]
MEAPPVERWSPWVAGAVGALAVIGPGLNGRAWINLDQSVLPHVPVPTVLLGVGPDIPRRGPFTILGALAAPWDGSAWVMKLLVVLLLAAATAGMARRLAPLGVLASVGAGMLYAFGPFLMGRLAVGHLGLLWAAAVVPWALPALVGAARSPARAFLWALLLAAGGYLAGTIALALVPVVAVAGRHRSPWRRQVAGLAAVIAAQALWLVPGTAVALAVGFDQPGGGGFRVALGGVTAPLRLLIGEGYFQTEAGAVPLPTGLGAGLGALVVVLAGFGWWSVGRTGADASAQTVAPGSADVPGGNTAAADTAVAGNAVADTALSAVATGWAAVVALLIGLAVPMTGLFDVTARLWAQASEYQPVNLAREPHRLFLVAWLVLVPALAWGGAELGRRRVALAPLGAVAPLALALVLMAPQVGGMAGQLRGVELPQAWEEVRNAVRSQPGTAATAPPWSYGFYAVGDVRRSYNPWPDFLGVDTVISSDARKGPARESDPRMDTVGPALDDYRRGQRGQLAPALRAAGVRWLVVPAMAQGNLYPSLADQRGLEPVVEDPAVSLYRVTGGTDPTAASQVLPGLWRRNQAADADPADGVVVDASADGWRVGGAAAPRGPGGRLVIPGGRRWAWYPPSVLTLLTQLALLAGALLSWRRVRGARDRAADEA